MLTLNNRLNMCQLNEIIKSKIEEKVIAQAIANPDLSQLRASNELKQGGILISISGVQALYSYVICTS